MGERREAYVGDKRSTVAPNQPFSRLMKTTEQMSTNSQTSNLKLLNSKHKLEQVLGRIEHAVAQAANSGRPTVAPTTSQRVVQLLAVSKTFPASAVIDFAHCGQIRFGENYVQEACEKIVRCRELMTDLNSADTLEWHFIGPLQSNKTRQVAEHFDWVQSIDRLKIAQRLSEQRPPQLAPLNVCIQVNVSSEASKSGCTLNEALELASAVSKLPNLQLRGLMAIPELIGKLPSSADGNSLQNQFDQMQQLFKQMQAMPLNGTHSIDTLSLGMSGDLEMAIAAGSTMVRVGSALFGER